MQGGNRYYQLQIALRMLEKSIQYILEPTAVELLLFFSLKTHFSKAEIMHK